MYFIAGPNGSGKSTFAHEFMKEKGLLFLNADLIAEELDPNREGKNMIFTAGKLFFQRLNTLIRDRSPFAIETTLSGRYTTKIIERLKREGFPVKMVYIFVDTPDLCIERIKIRVRNGGHHVSDDDVLRRYSRSKMNFWETYRGLVDNWGIYNNSGKSFLPVAIGKGNSYIIIDGEMFESFMEDALGGQEAR